MHCPLRARPTTPRPLRLIGPTPDKRSNLHICEPCHLSIAGDVTLMHMSDSRRPAGNTSEYPSPHNHGLTAPFASARTATRWPPATCPTSCPCRTRQRWPRHSWLHTPCGVATRESADIAGLTCTYGKMTPNLSVGQLCPSHKNPGLAGVFIVLGRCRIATARPCAVPLARPRAPHSG